MWKGRCWSWYRRRRSRRASSASNGPPITSLARRSIPSIRLRSCRGGLRNVIVGVGRGDEKRSGPRSRERKVAHEADAHLAGDGIARDRALELQRQRHRIGDRYFPGDVVAADGTVENLGGVAIGALRAGQRAAGALQAQRRVAIAHRRRHGKIPVSVHRHSSLLIIAAKTASAAV